MRIYVIRFETTEPRAYLKRSPQQEQQQRQQQQQQQQQQQNANQ